MTLSITPYPDGPYIVRGPIRLWDADGNEIEIRRKTVAICRCGRSRIHPLCDGTHKKIGFKADGEAPSGGDSGGDPAEGAPSLVPVVQHR